MTDAEDLARRYLNLWQDYLTALMADLRGPGLLQIWIAAYSALAGIRRRVTRPRSSKPGRPDRRLAPRPLPAHLASAMILWLTPRAALPVLKTVLLPGSVSGRQLHDVTAEIEALGTESVERAVEAAIAHRVECYLAGLEAYRRHRFRRHSVSRPVVWHEGTTRLLDYGRDARCPDRSGHSFADQPLLCPRSTA
jgi:hypothetical protein